MEAGLGRMHKTGEAGIPVAAQAILLHPRRQS